MRTAGALAAAISLAALIHDPTAPAADPKRVALLCVAVVALVLSRNAPRSPFSTPVLSWCGFVAWSALSLAWGAPSGWRDLATWVGATGVLLSVSRFPSAAATETTLFAGAGIGVASALFALAEWALGARGLFVHGGHGNPDWLGATLAITLPLTVALVHRTPRRWACCCIAIEMLALLLARSRTAWLATGIASLVALAIPHRGLFRVRNFVAGVGLSWIVVSGAEHHSPGRALDGRTWIWRNSVAAARAPWGVGLGQFAPAYLESQAKALATLWAPEAARRFVNATTAHNDWIQVTVESGWPALLLLLCAVAGAIRSCAARGFAAGAAALAAAAVCMTGDCPLRQPAPVIVIALLLAISDENQPFPHRRLPLSAVALAACAPLLALSVSGFLAARLATRARNAAPDVGIALLARAARLDPRSGEIALWQGIANLDLHSGEAAMIALQRARLILTSVGSEVALGNCHMLLDDSNEAAASYGRALRFDPGSFRARVNLAAALTRLGRSGEAEEQLRLARTLWPHHPTLEDLSDRPITD
ncbi:MAG: hypothetical protein EXR72_17955 [Myxococcales bacterium]|nr:hypothetical protein [Myxococcales bacterium]